MFLEFRTVVCEHMFEGNGEHHLTEGEEFLGCLRSMGGRGPCESKPTVEILKGDDVPATAVNESLYGVESNTMTRMQSLEVFGLPQDLPAIHLPWLPVMPDLLGEDSESSKILDEPSDGGGARNGQSLSTAEPSQKNL